MTDGSREYGDAAAATGPSMLRSRYDQMFPRLTPQEIERLRRFGSIRRYRDGERLSETGEIGRGMIVIISGHVAITQRDGLGHVTPVADQGPGQFLAEVGTLSGRAALVDGHAEGDVEALMIAPEYLRRLLIAEAELGERIMRALILRRVGLIETEASGPVLIGSPASADVVRLQNFLSRNGHPYHVLDPSTDPEAGELIARYAPGDAELPLVINPDGAVLRNPQIAELARALGMFAQSDGKKLYDVAVVGSGPAGLATAVYAASEGLSVVVLDSKAFGGQAGASARIENYLGFPTGISGQALAGRAFVQAQKFGAEIIIPSEVKSVDCSRADGALVLTPRRRRQNSGSITGDRDGRALSQTRHRQPGKLRGSRSVVLGLPDRSAIVQRRGCHSGGRRQFGGSGCGLPVRTRSKSHDPDPRRRFGAQHVALPGRSDRRSLQHRSHNPQRNRRAERQS